MKLATVGSEYADRQSVREVDQVVVECATKPLDELYFDLKPLSRNLGEVDHRSLIEFKKNGNIDWTAGVVEAKGIGVPATYTYSAKPRTNGEDILLEATNKAGHNLLETIVGLRINSQSRVSQCLERRRGSCRDHPIAPKNREGA